MLQEFLLLSYDTLFEFNLKKIRKKREFAFVQSKVIRMFLVFVLFKILFETITNDLSLYFFLRMRLSTVYTGFMIRSGNGWEDWQKRQGKEF